MTSKEALERKLADLEAEYDNQESELYDDGALFARIEEVRREIEALDDWCIEVKSSKSRQASADESEITPEMVEAGLDALYGFHITEPDDDEMRDAVRAVFIAMIGARS